MFNDIDRILDGVPYSDSDLLRKNFADGGWIASAPDLVKLLQALHQHKILNAESQKIMLQKPNYATDASDYPAMGWDSVWQKQSKRYYCKAVAVNPMPCYSITADLKIKRSL